MGVQEKDPLLQLSLPPGFRFYPTDEELLVQYLCKKVAGHDFPLQIIGEIDLYKFDPWVLPSKATFGEKEWYFFSPRDRKYPNGSRPNRVAGSGYWKATGTDKVITSQGRKVGIKKALVFYVGKAPKGSKTNWIMHEYRLFEPSRKNGSAKEALKWVMDQPAWNRSEGRDHILPVHHPWSFKSVRKFMKKAIWLLPDMDSTGNWYKPGQVYLEKDLILPYVANLDLCDAKCLSASRRTTLLFFRGRLKRNSGGKIRAKLVEDLRGADGVSIEEGTAGEGGKEAAQNGMRKSIFCLNPAGDTPSSARLFDAIVSGCIPVIVSDELELPFEGILDYRKIALFVSSSDALQPGWLLSFLKSVSAGQIKEMQANLAKYTRHFLYSHPAQPLGPEDLVWRMMAGKLVNIKLHTRRSQRLVKGSRSVCTCECRSPNVTSPGPLS